jgi:hypothetical protein
MSNKKTITRESDALYHGVTGQQNLASESRLTVKRFPQRHTSANPPNSANFSKVNASVGGRYDHRLRI